MRSMMEWLYLRTNWEQQLAASDTLQYVYVAARCCFWHLLATGAVLFFQNVQATGTDCLRACEDRRPSMRLSQNLRGFGLLYISVDEMAFSWRNWIFLTKCNFWNGIFLTKWNFPNEMEFSCLLSSCQKNFAQLWHLNTARCWANRCTAHSQHLFKKNPGGGENLPWRWNKMIQPQVTVDCILNKKESLASNPVFVLNCKRKFNFRRS
jgi:hypothetical protein